MNQICLKCGHVQEVAQILPSDACPACGAIYAKVQLAMENARQIQTSIQPVLAPVVQSAEPKASNILRIILLCCCVALASSTAVLGALYYQESRLNSVLLSQRRSNPDVPIAKPAPAVAAALATAPIKAEPQSAGKPPANLAEGAEVMVVSGYEAANQASNGTVVRVVIDRPGKAVLLVLSSYDKIAWHVEATGGTQLKGIVVSGYERPSVYTTTPAPVYLSKLPYGYDKDSGNFASLLNGLNALFGVERVDAFRGAYALPNSITIDKLDPAKSDLTIEGDMPEAPLKSLKFELTTSDYGKAQWSLKGPENPAKPVMLAPARTVKAAQDQRIYQIVSHSVFVQDSATGKKQQLEMPDNFPRLSWPVDVAYDSKRHYVTLATLGGEGFLYRYDTNTGKWLDFRSLDNVDISSFAYDEVADRYVAWTGYGLLFMAGDGTPLYERRLANRLPGFNRLYDTGNAQPPSLLVVPKGDQIALVKQQGPSVGMIWYYDVPLDVVQLTYKVARAGGAQ